MNKILEKQGFICDMDGVIYHGNKILDGVSEFVNWMLENNKKFEKTTKEILEKNNIPCDSIVFVTNDFHIYRAKKYATYCGFETAHALSTKTDLFTFVPALTREVLGVIDMWVFKLK